MSVAARNRIIRQIAENHAAEKPYQSKAWRASMAYWLRQVRSIAQ